MHVLCLLSQKGGAGKSTVVQSLAVCADQHGQNTLIVELDPQGTLKDWSNRREAETPHVHQTLPQSLGDVLDDARERGVDWVFIDTPGHHNPAAVAAAAHADVILIPCKILSMKDFDAIRPTIAEADRAQKPTYMIMNQVPPNAPRLIRRRQASIQENLKIKVLSVCLSRRADFEYCDDRGLSAAEFNPGGAAANEIDKLYVLVQAILRVSKPDEDPVQPQTVPPAAAYRAEPSAAANAVTSVPQEPVRQEPGLSENREIENREIEKQGAENQGIENQLNETQEIESEEGEASAAQTKASPQIPEHVVVVED